MIHHRVAIQARDHLQRKLSHYICFEAGTLEVCSKRVRISGKNMLSQNRFRVFGAGTAFLVLIVVLALLAPAAVSAHNVSQRDASFVEANKGSAIPAFMYLVAKHMVTGYDHLLFLVGVIFFLYRLKDVIQYVSLFTVGHSLTLLAGVFANIHANSHIVDAIIGFSVVYKAFDNMDGFKRFLGFQPNTKIAVLIFGLFHGFGLATKLQEFALAKEGLVANIVSFNVGVEIGQCLALTAVLIGL